MLKYSIFETSRSQRTPFDNYPKQQCLHLETPCSAMDICVYKSISSDFIQFIDQIVYNIDNNTNESWAIQQEAELEQQFLRGDILFQEYKNTIFFYWVSDLQQFHIRSQSVSDFGEHRMIIKIDRSSIQQLREALLVFQRVLIQG